MLKCLTSLFSSKKTANSSDDTSLNTDNNTVANAPVNKTEKTSRFQPKMEISQDLLDEIENWEIIELPRRIYHGCQSSDTSVDIQKLTLIGNKWFSTSMHYAGSYAWHFMRNANPPANSRYCLKLSSSKVWRGIKRPDDFKDLPNFLSKCFKLSGYNNSFQFQHTLQLHLHELFGRDSDIIGYYWADGGDGNDEICIPECQEYYKVESATLLPDEKEEFDKEFGNK